MIQPKHLWYNTVCERLRKECGIRVKRDAVDALLQKHNNSVEIALGEVEKDPFLLFDLEGIKLSLGPFVLPYAVLRKWVHEPGVRMVLRAFAGEVLAAAASRSDL